MERGKEYARFGIESDDYWSLFKKQSGACIETTRRHESQGFLLASFSPLGQYRMLVVS
jgi:hypothetical protein